MKLIWHVTGSDKDLPQVACLHGRLFESFEEVEPDASSNVLSALLHATRGCQVQIQEYFKCSFSPLQQLFPEPLSDLRHLPPQLHLALSMVR